MNLAQALFRRVEYREPKSQSRVGRQGGAGGRPGIPVECVRQAGMSYFLGQVSARPIMWRDVAQWVSGEQGHSITPEGIRQRVLKFASGRRSWDEEWHDRD